MTGRNRRKALALLLGVALALGVVGSTVAVEPTTTDTVMTGHTTWMEESSAYDGCLAGIAGLLKQQVTWFNGQTLFETSEGNSDDTWIYFTDGGLGGDQRVDPTSEDLIRSNNTYQFEDPNDEDHTWTVKEYFVYDGLPDGVNGVGDIGDEEPGVNWDRIYIWAVNASASSIEDETTLGKDYNFVGVVDTCKFDSARERNETHDNQNESEDKHDPRWQHDSANNEGEHDHDVYFVDLWVGGEPETVLGTETVAGQQEEGAGS